ncbi:MAG: putative sulfate exporter family transporter [Bacteroidales bacterium]|nr:putative sulfate exporter family transporter [Bacteroidales bacterium]
MNKNNNYTNLFRKEDWLSVWIGVIIIALGATAVLTGWFDFSALSFKTWTVGESLSEKDAAKVIPLAEQLCSWAFWGKCLRTVLVLGTLFGVGVKLQGEKLSKFIPAFLMLFVIAVIVRMVSAEFTLKRYLEWAFWALLIGLLIANTVGVPKWLKPAIRTEFYIKTGLVVFGFSVLFSNIAKFGLYGLGIAWGVTPIVILFMWWFGNKVLKITNKPLLITVASATSVCGTSAAIATGAASGAKKEDLSVAISVSIIFTILMMVFEPMIIEWVGLGQIMGGALIGGTIDSTGAVVLAGSVLGPEAEQVASLVKMIQNILIGFIAFFVAIFFARKVDKNGKSEVGASEIWHRFPKFILGFIVASIVASIIFVPAFGAEQTGAINKVLGQYKDWAFVLAFTSIGLDTNFKQLAKSMQGGKVLWLYIVGQTFNIILTFAVVWLLLSGKIFPQPDIKTFTDKEEKIKAKKEASVTPAQPAPAEATADFVAAEAAGNQEQK